MLKYFTTFTIFLKVWLFKRLHSIVKYISIYVPGKTVVELGFFFILDADIFNVGEAVYALSECSAAETGPARRTFACYMYN